MDKVELVLKQIDRESHLSLHQQIYTILNDLVRNNYWKEDFRLPYEKDLAKHFDVNRHTVRKALFMLEQEGKIISIKRKGTFIRRNQKTTEKQSRTIGCIIPGFVDGNDFINKIMNGIHTVLKEQDYSLMINAADNSIEEEAKLIKSMASRDIAGLILSPAATGRHTNETCNMIRRMQLPFMTVDREILDETGKIVHTNIVKTDNIMGIRMALEHFFSKGHERIFMASTQIASVNPTLTERENEYQRIMLAKGLTPYIMRADSPAYDYSIYIKEIEKMQVTGILGSWDFPAFHMGNALQKHGIRIPNDISLMGFGDVKNIVSPFSISTINQHAERLGETVAIRIIEAIEHKDLETTRTLIMPEIVDNGSVKILN